MNRILFSVSRLEKEDVTLEGSLPGNEFLALDKNDTYTADGDCSYELTGHYVDGGVLVEGEAECKVDSQCGRCLKKVVLPLKKKNIKLYFENVDTEELDVTEDLREELLMELPINPLCSDDCRGLCPKCGADLNSGSCSCSPDDAPPTGDPAWSELDKLGL